ncbi:MAG: nuclear transport factor 2 family protein [Acidobacteria bacterium]|nr:nuclear transport factor 2 family protein [Acidobacteriota bacterium]
MDATERLRQTFDRFREALFASDTASLREMLAVDYRGFDPRGLPQDREATLAAFGPGGVRLSRYALGELDVRVVGDAGFITGTGDLAGTWGDAPFTHRVRFVDVYLFRDRRWQLWLSQVTTLADP